LGKLQGVVNFYECLRENLLVYVESYQLSAISYREKYLKADS